MSDPAVNDMTDGDHDRRSSPSEDLLGLLIGAAALVLFALSPWLVDLSGPEPFYKGPLIFPLIALAATLAGALPSATRTLMSPARLKGDEVRRSAFPHRTALLFLLMCFFPAAVSALGIEAATFTAVFVGMLLVGQARLRSLCIALLLAALVHLAFRTLLDVWFPSPWLLETIGS